MALGCFCHLHVFAQPFYVQEDERRRKNSKFSGVFNVQLEETDCFDSLFNLFTWSFDAFCPH